ncbi:MAG: radical SAM protein [Planctomycetes bacterium]|nr:radical SAM protein [Planctomycetota bacterium]
MQVVLTQFEGIDNTPALPLAVGRLVATARKDPRLAAARFSIHVARRPIAAAVDALGRPDVLGLSLYPWNAVYSLEVARAARAAHPGALLVAGGPGVPRRPESARRFMDLHPALDVLVFSEGELAFRELLAAWQAGGDLDARLAAVGGIAFRPRAQRDACRLTAPPDRVHDLAETGSPYLDGTFDALLAEQPGVFASAIMETNRGCPFSCTFCDWSLTKKVVEFPQDRVLAELDWIARNGFNNVIIADANFGIRKRDHDITRHLAALKARTGRPALVYFYLTKNDHERNLGTIELLHEAGIACCVGLAVQDFDGEVLSAVKRDTIQTGEAMRLREICAARGIPTLNELILGLPRQTYASFARTVVEAMPPYPRHTFVLYACRLLDNTDMASPAERERFGIETRRCLWRSPRPDWDPVLDEHQELVVGTRDMPVPDWRRTYRFAFLASALYNLRLLRVVLQALREALRVDLVDYLGWLCERTGDAAPGSVFAAVGREFDRFLDSILAGGAFTLPHPAAGPAPRESAEAVVAAALERPDAFFAEAEALTRRFLDERGRDATLLAEAFRYQALVTPRRGQTEPVTLDLLHDWPAFVAGGGQGTPPPARPTRTTFVPPPYAAVPDPALFMSFHLATAGAGASTGEVRAEPLDVHAGAAT